MLNCRIAKMLTLLVAINPRPALSNASLVNALKVRDTNIREVVDELDPDDTNGCFSLGELDIVFRSDNVELEHTMKSEGGSRFPPMPMPQ